MLVDNFSAGILGVIMAVFGHLRASARSSSAFTDAAGRRGRLPGRQRPAAADLDLHRAGEGAVPQQRDQPRRADAAGHPAGAETGKSVLFLLEANPGPGCGLLLAYSVFGKGTAQAHGPGCGDHPVLRRHPRDLLPLRADEAPADPGHDPRRHDGDLHQRRCSGRGCARRRRPGRSSRSTRRPPAAASWA